MVAEGLLIQLIFLLSEAIKGEREERKSADIAKECKCRHKRYK